jgi:precorrin-6Y C5,15-methyltransferase (decarboxylating)
MKEIVIIGAGLGPETLTREGLSALINAEVCFGAPRLLALFETPAERYPYYKAVDISNTITQSGKERFAVLVSGDTGFYSAAAGLCEALVECKPRLIPGISSLNAFFARLGLPWQDAALFSAHGKPLEDAALTGLVRRNRLVFCLTGKNAAALGATLCAAGFEHLNIFTGENLGTPEERVGSLSAAELSRASLAALTVLLVVNEEASDGVPSGLPDGLFLRAENIPMTKSEIRSIVLSRLAVKPDDLCYDIGAGTGSVSVELALHAWRGQVFAIERRKEALPLIAENCHRFHVGNVRVLCGEAPEAFPLPPPDVAFIGGSGGKIPEIVAALREKNPAVRIVVTAVTIETASSVLAALSNAEISWVSVARGKAVGGAGGSHLFTAQNPIIVVSAGGTP